MKFFKSVQFGPKFTYHDFGALLGPGVTLCVEELRLCDLKQNGNLERAHTRRDESSAAEPSQPAPKMQFASRTVQKQGIRRRGQCPVLSHVCVRCAHWNNLDFISDFFGKS